MESQFLISRDGSRRKWKFQTRRQNEGVRLTLCIQYQKVKHTKYLSTTWPRRRRRGKRIAYRYWHAYLPGRYLNGEATTNARARAICHDGDTVEADVLIGADGVRSLVRGVMLPNEHLETAPYIAWRGLVRQSHLTASAQAQLGDAFVVVHEPNEELVTYPVLGDDGHVYINIVWYRRVSDAQRRQLFTDEAGAYHPQGISPLAIRPGFVAQAKADASAIFHPHLAEAIALAPEFLLQVIVDQAAPVMAVGRTALVGDAAFVARPHVGQGVTKAGGDAWALTQFLEAGRDDVVGALAQYSASRVPVGKRAVARARELGAVLMPDERSLSEWSAHYSDAQNLLVDTAVELPGLAHIGVMDEGVT